MIDIIEKITIDYSAKGDWNCNRCILFDKKICECNSEYRYMLGNTKGFDCENCKYPFILKESEVDNG